MRLRTCAVAIVYCGLYVFVPVAEADLIFDSAYQNVVSYSLIGDGNLHSQTDTTAQFGYSNNLVASDVTFVTADYSYSQASGVTTFATDVDLYQDGSWLSGPGGNYSSHASYRMSVDFTPTVDQTYQIKPTVSGSDPQVYPQTLFYLLDNTLPFPQSYIYLASNSLTPLIGSDSGMLHAGRSYSLGVRFSLASTGNGHSSSGSGSFEFTATPAAVIPEPSSLALLGFGGIGLGCGAYRRRRLAV